MYWPEPPDWSTLEHGFARAIALAAAVRGVEPLTTRDVRTVPGCGIRGNADGKAVAVGNSRFDERPRMAAGSRPSPSGRER